MPLGDAAVSAFPNDSEWLERLLERPEGNFRISPQQRYRSFELNVESNLNLRPDGVRSVESRQMVRYG